MTVSLLRVLLPIVALSCLLAATADADPSVLLGTEPRQEVVLNGTWQGAPADGIDFQAPPPSDGWIPMEVPGSPSPLIDSISGTSSISISRLKSDKFDPHTAKNAAAWFRTRFTLPTGAPRRGHRVLLRFDGMSFKSVVFVNGEHVGTSLLGGVHKEYDITDLLRADGENELLVGLTNRAGIIDMDHGVYLAPSRGTAVGIWGDVRLRFVPDVYLDDYHIKTYVEDQRLEIDYEIRNATNQPRRVQPYVLVSDVLRRPQTQVVGEVVTIPPQTTQIVTVTDDWVAPVLWAPETPALYLADLQLRQGDQTLDAVEQTFGFRELTTRGRDFYLNGRRITLLRDSATESLPADYQSVLLGDRRDGGIVDLANHPYNNLRQHQGRAALSMLYLFDTAGVIATPETAPWTVHRFPADKRELWLENVKTYVQEFIRERRNHPSVLIYSLTNETYWDRRQPDEMEAAREVLEAAREVDSFALMMADGDNNWDGMLPITNIHYPEDEAGDVREQYPNSGLVVPNDFYWLRESGPNHAWRADFEWDRPVFIGEYWHIHNSVDQVVSYAGEAVYDWRRWRFQDIRGRYLVPNNPYQDMLTKMTDAYRVQGVAGLNPWSGNGQVTMPKVYVRGVAFHPNFFGGEEASRKVIVTRDSLVDWESMHLLCKLEMDGRIVWSSQIPLKLEPGDSYTMDVPFEIPPVSRTRPAKLTIVLRHRAAGGPHELFRHEETVYVYPRTDLRDLDANAIRIYDPAGKTAAALKELGLEALPVDDLLADSLGEARVLILGEEAGAHEQTAELSSFVRGGGRLIVLRQQDAVRLSDDFPTIDPDHAASRTWARTFDHPVLAGVTDEQLSYWLPDNLVAVRSFSKPSAGPALPLMDSGGRSGMEWTPLVEVPQGEGVALLTQLDLVRRATVEPMAGEMLGRLIRYALNYQPTHRQPMRVLAPDDAAIFPVLDRTGVEIDRTLDGSGPILIDASWRPAAGQMDQVAAELRQGAAVWLHGVKPDDLSRFARLFPFEPALHAFDDTIQSAVRVSDVPRMNGLSSADFFWTRVNTAARDDFFERAQPTADIGQYELALPGFDAGTPLTAPGVLAEVPVGDGLLVVDELPWAEAHEAEPEKVTRIVSALARNLGAAFGQTGDAAEYDLAFADLSEQANMGYMDETAGDGRGGWTDQGENDMRYFLINHTGVGLGGAEVGVEAFPRKVRLGGRMFQLVDAKARPEHAVVTLGGQDDTQLPQTVNGVKLGSKADRLWVLHTAAFAPDEAGAVVAEYVLHYADGSQAVLPVRYGQDISDWWRPRSLPNAEVAWTGQNDVHSPVGVYLASWENPNPEKTITTIDLRGGKTRTQVVVLAITAGRQKP